MDTQQRYTPKLRTALHHVQEAAQALLGDAFGKLAGEQREAVEAIANEIQAMDALLEEIASTIGLLNIGQRYYLHERFQRHLVPIIERARELQHNLLPPLTQPQLACVQGIVESILDLQRNLNNLWIHSRIQHGKIQVMRAEFDVEHLLLPYLHTAVPDGDAIQLEMHIPEDFPYIRGDLKQTRTALQQVLENAVRYTRQGYIRVTAVTGNNLAKIRVQDNGRGIAEEHHEAIFQPFYQVNPEEHGLGLGLTIARALMNLQDGSLTVESVAGTGATFTVVLPTAQQAR